MKHHRLRTGDKLLAEASHFDQMWGIGPQTDDSDAHDPHFCRGKNLLGQALFTARDLLRHNMNRFAHPYSCPQFFAPILCEGIHEINPTPLTRLRLSARAFPGPPSSFRSIFPTRQRTTAPMCWLSPLAPRSPPPTRPRSPSTARAL